MTFRQLLTLLLTIPLLWTAAAAQVPATGPAQPIKRVSEEEKEKARKELERKALSLLDEILRGAQALKLEENRAVISAQAAELLWEHDEKRARALFREAIFGLAELMSGEPPSRASASGWMLAQLRPQLLQTIALKDAQFALELLRASRPAAEPDTVLEEEVGEQELRMEQAIAALAAEHDPQAALKMAEESLRSGVTFGTLSTLDRLRRKDADAATRLAGEIIKKLKGEDLNANREASMVALSLLRGILQPEGEPGSSGVLRRPGLASEKPKPLKLEDETVRELTDLVAGAAMKESFGQQWLLWQFRSLLPELEKRMPARAAQLRLRAAEIEKTLDPRERAWMQYQTVAAGGSVEAALEAAAKAPAEMRPAFYSAAAMNLMRSGDTERARQIVADNLRGEERERLLSQIELLAVAKSVEAGKHEEAGRLVSRIRQKDRRVVALARLALALVEKGERKIALSLLEEARGLIGRQPDDQKEIEALLEVARAYALVEPARTFEIIDPLVDQANDMLAAAALLEKFRPGDGGMFKKGEMLLYPGLNNLGGPYARYVKALAELARVDFERTRATADRFQRDEARLLARLVIARSVLLRGPLALLPEFEGDGFHFGSAIVIGN